MTALRISVPPPPCLPLTYCCAAARLAGVFGRGDGHSASAVLLNVMTLNVSCGRIVSIALVMTALAFSIGKPFIEPELSSTKTSSRGTTRCSSTRAGGCTTSVGVPSLGFPSPSVDGNVDHRLRVTGGTPNAAVLYIVGFVPRGGLQFFGCPLEVLPDLISIAGTLDSAGVGVLPFPLAFPGISLTGGALIFQAAVIDLAAPNRIFGISSGKRVVFG